MDAIFDGNHKKYIEDILKVGEKQNYKKGRNTICCWRYGYGTPATRSEVVLKDYSIELYVGEETVAYNAIRQNGRAYFDNHLKHSQYELALRFRSMAEAEPILRILSDCFNGTETQDVYEAENSGNNPLSALVSHMKQEGLLFSSDKSELNLSEAYAILGGKTSVRYLQDARDGVNGYVLFCAKDEVDKNRICTTLDKECYPNGDAVRPFKVQIGLAEIEKVIGLLKENPLNVVIDVVSDVPSAKAQALDDTHTYEEKEKHASEIKLDQLESIAFEQGEAHPREVTTTVTQRVRNPYIAEYAKRRAGGICQLCGNSAPFKNKDGEPYLESHHIVWLSEGGEDTVKNTVALCPNCHKKMHVLNLPEDVERLIACNEELSEE